MKTKLITIPGRGKVLCRALKLGEGRLPTDVWDNGRTYAGGDRCQQPVSKATGTCQAYRPLPKKPRKVKGEEGAPINVWVRVSADGQVVGALTHHQIKRLTGKLFPTFPLEVTITLRRKK